MNELKQHIHDNTNGLDYTPSGGGAAYIRNICKNIILSGTINCSCPVS